MKKFKEFIKEATGSSFFLNPRGELAACDVKHISSVTRNPSKFGLSKDYIKSIYEKYNEKIGTEGKAREEILIYLLARGWVRMRRYRNRYWSVTVGRRSPKLDIVLRDWARNILKGISGFKEDDKYMPVKIVPVVAGSVKDTTVEKLANANIYESWGYIEHDKYPKRIKILEDFKEEKFLIGKNWGYPEHDEYPNKITILESISDLPDIDYMGINGL